MNTDKNISVHLKLQDLVLGLEEKVKQGIMQDKRISKNKEVAIVIGHTSRQKGACSPRGIPCEWDYNKKVAQYLEDIVDIYYYDKFSRGYTSRVKKNAKKLNAKNYKLVIEMHYNAASPAANGTECLYYFRNKRGKELSQIYSKMFCKKFGTKLRGNGGAKALTNKGDRGFGAVYYPKATTILVEPFFGSSASDVAKVKGKEKEYADLLREFITENVG